MSKNNILLKATDFRYPTREELQQAKVGRPQLKRFSFPYVSEIVAIFNHNASLEDVARESQLHSWNHCLLNRLGSLEHAHTLANVHYNRGLPDDVKDYHDEHYINRVQFGFYAETYFYFFGSVRDTIAQLVNVYDRTGLLDHQVYLNDKFFKKIKDQHLKTLLTDFVTATAATSDIRNALAHRYLLTHEDYRPKITYQNGHPTFESGRGDSIKSSELLQVIKSSFQQLADFLDVLSSALQVKKAK